MDAIAAHISAGDAQEESVLQQHAKKCMQPGIKYYFEQVSTNMKASLEAFKAARLFSPFTISWPSGSNTAHTSENVPRNPTLSQILKQHSRRVYDFDEEELVLDRKHLWKQPCGFYSRAISTPDILQKTLVVSFRGEASSD